MTRLIGLKELQQNTKMVREQVKKGVRFIVVYRSKPIFEINPIEKDFDFAEDMKKTNLYSDNFISAMKMAEDELNSGKTAKYSSTEEFLKSLD